MKNCCRYIAAYGLGAILLLPVLAMCVLQVGQAYIQSTRDERLESEELVQVKLQAKEVVWEEEGKELWVGNHMFDVSAYTIKDGYYHLTGVFDDDETEIAGSLLHSLFAKKGTALLHLLLLLQCFSASLLLPELVNKFRIRSKDLTFYFSVLPTPFHMVLAPPPRQ